MENKAEKVQRLQSKAAELLTFFIGKEMPKAPFLLSQGETCIDPDKMVAVCLETMDYYSDNPFAGPFVSAYLRMNNLKILIERANTKQNRSRSKKLPSPANAGN